MQVPEGFRINRCIPLRAVPTRPGLPYLEGLAFEADAMLELYVYPSTRFSVTVRPSCPWGARDPFLERGAVSDFSPLTHKRPHAKPGP